MKLFWQRTLHLISWRVRVFTIVACLVLVSAIIAGWNLWPRTERSTCAGNFDLVLTGAEIIDGLGGPSFFADVGVRNKRIACIGTIEANDTQRLIHAEGLTVAPGFIDVHTHVERNVSSGANFFAVNFVQQGVTTIITGNCGRSFLDIGKFLRDLEAAGTDVNVATLIGHNTIRLQVMQRSAALPSHEQLRKMKSLAKAAMRDGALGLSTGLEYIPGTFSKTDELVELARIARDSDGLYVSHLRHEGPEGEEAIREAISIADRAGIHVHISHLKAQGPDQWGAAQQRLGLVHSATGRGLRISVDQYPYTASSTGIVVLLPAWLSEGGLRAAKVKLGDPATRKRVRDEMLGDLRALGWRDYSFAKVAYYGADHSLVGMTIPEISRLANRPQIADRRLSYAPVRFWGGRPARLSTNQSELELQAETVIDLYSHGGAQMVFFNMAEKDVETIMKDPDVMFGSDSSVREENSSALPHPRGLGTFPRVLGLYARQKQLFSIEEAIRRMTSLPAMTFGLKERGQIKEGYWADLVIFNRNRILDAATYEEPLTIPRGIDYVIVNGSVVLDHRTVTKAVPGMALRRAAGPRP
jgi:N-acyl-D-amino-acid deacylase